MTSTQTVETKTKTCCGPECCSDDSQAAAKPVASAAAEEIVKKVQEQYSSIATGQLSGCCGPQSACAPASDAAVSLGIGYKPGDLAEIPQEANLGLGCGAPLGFLALQAGETVLDLGSGAGIDAFLSARQVGASGKVIGVDMTPAMLERARRNADRGGFTNVDFREGRLEALPVAAGSIDAVTSNCVINLVPDKAAAFREIARVLRPGGRLVISDILLSGELPAAIKNDLLAYVGCVSGAMRQEAYFALLGSVGLTDVEVLRDVDYVAMLAESAPDEVAQLEARTGVSRDQVIGRIRSVTFRATKPVVN